MGPLEGVQLGVSEGWLEGIREGGVLGWELGWLEGCVLGWDDGDSDGWLEEDGDNEGWYLGEGWELGWDDGWLEGWFEGCDDGWLEGCKLGVLVGWEEGGTLEEGWIKTILSQELQISVLFDRLNKFTLAEGGSVGYVKTIFMFEISMRSCFKTFLISIILEQHTAVYVYVHKPSPLLTDKENIIVSGQDASFKKEAERFYTHHLLFGTSSP